MRQSRRQTHDLPIIALHEFLKYYSQFCFPSRLPHPDPLPSQRTGFGGDRVKKSGFPPKTSGNDIGRIYLALSGGMDSVVLLESLLMTSFPKNNITVLHVNHQLQKEAAIWQQACAQLAKQHGLGFLTHQVKRKPKKGDSIEAFARDERYQFFKKQVKKNELLLTAHHLDDQIETFFVNVLRGSGVEGISGMQPLSVFGKGHLGRPFLSLKREALKTFADKHQLQWHDDPSNADTRFVRNFLRLELLPVLAGRFPAYRETIARSMQHCADLKELMDESVTGDVAKVIVNNELHIPTLKSLSSTRQNLLIKAWIKQVTGKMANSALIREVHKAMAAREDRRPKIKFLAFEVVRKKEWMMIGKQD